jgi:hypothetical protein
MKLRPFIFGLFAAVLIACALPVRAQDGLLGALSEGNGTSRTLVSFDQQVAAADFDNDQKPDGAVLLPSVQSNGQRSFRIEFHVTAGQNSAITFSTKETGLSISALDVNHDGAPDIVVEKTLTHERLQVYLNDGHGSFHKARLEAFLFPDPSAPLWRSWTTPILPSVYLPSSRGFETAGLRTLSVVVPNQTRELNSWPDVPAAQSGARLPSSSRAPPSPLPLQ